jgi:hypothetical protein
MRRLFPAFFTVGLVAAAGCGQARLVNRTQYGGTYALEGDRNKAMEDAHAQISAHCRGPYTILSEGEEVIGTDTAQGNETYVTEEGTVVNEGGQQTRNAVEWRLQYQCGANTQVPAQPSTYAEPPPGAPAPYGQAPPPAGQ